MAYVARSPVAGVLIGELKSSRHASTATALDVTSFPTLLCLAAAAGEDGGAADEDEETPQQVLHRFENREPTYHRLQSFVGKCALRKPVLKKPAAKEEL